MAAVETGGKHRPGVFLKQWGATLTGKTHVYARVCTHRGSRRRSTQQYHLWKSGCAHLF